MISDRIAAGVIRELAKCASEAVKDSAGQEKVIWTRVINQLHAAYYRKFSETVAIDEQDRILV